MGAGRAFADVLSYPGVDLPARVDACVAALSGGAGAGRAACSAPGDAARLAPDASVHELLAFRSEAGRLGLARLEEAYTAAFDLDPACSLAVGHHVFGENARRSVFMARLADMYRDAGLPPAEGELPDHLPAILRYLDAGSPGPAMDDLVADAVVPALERVSESLGRTDHPYAPVVRALLGHLAPALATTSRQGTPA